MEHCLFKSNEGQTIYLKISRPKSNFFNHIFKINEVHILQFFEILATREAGKRATKRMLSTRLQEHLESLRFYYQHRVYIESLQLMTAVKTISLAGIEIVSIFVAHLLCTLGCCYFKTTI